MTTAYTPNIHLGQPATGDRSWGTPLNANATSLDGLAPIGGLNVTLHEVPSASLNVAVSAGNYLKQDGTVGSYGGTASQAITLSSTKVLYLDLTASGALTVAASFPSTAHVRLATVATGSATVSSITDARVVCNVIGTMLDGVNLTVGTVSGTEIGTAVGQKLGFWGKTPVVQPTMGAATASSSWTSVEQGMLNTLWTNLRAIGLGS
jgi:hypothetical protein